MSPSVLRRRRFVRELKPAPRRSPLELQGEAFAQGSPRSVASACQRGEVTAHQPLPPNRLAQEPRQASRFALAPPSPLGSSLTLSSTATKGKVVLGTSNPVAPESVKNNLDVAAPTVGTNGGTSLLLRSLDRLLNSFGPQEEWPTSRSVRSTSSRTTLLLVDSRMVRRLFVVVERGTCTDRVVSQARSK